MNTLPFIENFFFKKDADNQLTINTTKTMLVIFLIAVVCLFLGSALGSILYGFEIYWMGLLGYIVSAIAFAAPFYMLIRFAGRSGDVVSTFNDENKLQYSVILFVVLLVICVLFSIASGVFYDNIAFNIILPLIIAGFAAGLMYFLIGKLINVEPLPNNVVKKNHYLAFIIGYIGAFFTSLLGIIVGIYLFTRKDNEYAKIYAIFLICFSILMWIVSFYFGTFDFYYY